MLKNFIFISFLIISCAYLSAQFLLLRQDSQIVDSFKQEAELILTAEKKILSQNIEDIFSDLLFLAQQELFQNNSINKNRYNQLNQTTNSFRLFSQNKKRYDQIRYIDVNGNEQIRINYENKTARIVPISKLQNKIHRYYFNKTMSLKAGEIYISPFDLNIENNQIEVPLKPMIRFSTPVTDRNNLRNGIVILNYYGQIILDKFLEIKQGSADTIMLLNSDGYYIIGHNRDQEWSFMFPDKKYGHLASDFPKIWQKIKANKQHFHQSEHGLFFHNYLKPNDFLNKTKQKECNNCTFIMLAYQSKEQFEQLKENYLNKILPYIFFISLVLMISLWIVLNYYNKAKLNKKNLSAIQNSLIGERDIFVGGPTIVFKWYNHFGWPVEYVSDNVKNVLGYQAEQFINQQLNFSSIIVPEHRQQVIDSLNNAKKKMAKHGLNWMHFK